VVMGLMLGGGGGLGRVRVCTDDDWVRNVIAEAAWEGRL